MTTATQYGVDPVSCFVGPDVSGDGGCKLLTCRVTCIDSVMFWLELVLFLVSSGVLFMTKHFSVDA